MTEPNELLNIVTLLSLLVVKPLLLLLLVGSVYVLLRKQAVEIRYQILSAGFLGALLLFPLELFVPHVTLYWLPEFDGSVGWLNYVLWVYGAGTFIGLTRYFNNLLLLIDIAGKSEGITDESNLSNTISDVRERLGLQQAISVKLSDYNNGPFVWGWIKPEVILPKDLLEKSPRQIEHVLLHELSHIYRQDWIMLMVVQLLCVLLWCVPGIRWLAARHQDMAEQACDNMVVRCEADAVEYAEDLLDFAKRKNNNLALNAQGQSPLFARLAMLINGTIKRDQLHLSFSDYIFIGSLCVIVVLSSVKVDFIGSAPRYFSYELFPYSEIDRIVEETKQPQVVSDVTLPVRPAEYLYQAPKNAEKIHFDVASIGNHHIDITLEPVEVKALVITNESRFSDFEVLDEARPYYPVMALQRKIEGYAVVEFDISETGEVIEPRVSESSHKRIFNQTSLQAIRKFKFTPVNIAGESHPTRGATVCFKFEIHERSPPSVVCPE